MKYCYDDKGHKQEIYDLYQEVFEDPKAFADYYFEEIYAKNQVMMAQNEHGLLGTIHLNPYELSVKGEEIPAHYIVAVATKASARRQGIMRGMLTRVLCDMAKDGEPFTYLEPADKAYYEPFDFVFAMDWSKETIEGEKEQVIGNSRSYEEQDGNMVIEFMESQLGRYDIYTKVTKEYLSRMKKEAISQDGDLILWEKQGELSGVFMYGREGDTVFVHMVFCKDKDEFRSYLQGYFQEQKIEITRADPEVELQEPSIMVRILDLKKMISFIRGTRSVKKVIQIIDPIIKKNQGVFELNLTKEKGSIIETKKKPELTVTIQELTEILFGKKEWTDLKELVPISGVYITEEV